jgi:predicted dehydrogenase
VVYGVDPIRRAGLEEDLGKLGIRVATSLETVLRDPGVDGIILATPHKLHEEQVLAVVAAGKNVFCEKPLTMTSSGAERVLAACESAGKVLGIGHERRFEPAFEELERLIAGGALGELLLLEANISHDNFRRLRADNWRLDPEHAPAGMMTAVGIHLTDLFVLHAGAAAEVRARTGTLIFDPPAEDFVTASIAFKSGVRGTISSLSVTPFYGRFTALGDLGWVEIVSEANVDQGKPTHLTYYDGKERQHVSYEAIDAVTLNFEAWADAVEGRAPYRFTREQLLENIRLFEAIVTSSQQRGATLVL